jgi:hypothetical protein
MYEELRRYGNPHHHSLRFPEWSAEFEVINRQAVLTVRDHERATLATLHLTLDRTEGIAELLWMVAVDLRRNGATSALERLGIDEPWKEDFTER